MSAIRAFQCVAEGVVGEPLVSHHSRSTGAATQSLYPSVCCVAQGQSHSD